MHWRKTPCSLEDRRQHQVIFPCSFHLQTFPDWCIKIKLQCIFQPEWVHLRYIMKLSIFCSPNQQNGEDSPMEFTLITLGLQIAASFSGGVNWGEIHFWHARLFLTGWGSACQAVFHHYTCSFTLIHIIREAVSSISDLDECQHVEKHKDSQKSSFLLPSCILWQLMHIFHDHSLCICLH